MGQRIWMAYGSMDTSYARMKERILRVRSRVLSSSECTVKIDERTGIEKTHIVAYGNTEYVTTVN